MIEIGLHGSMAAATTSLAAPSPRAMISPLVDAACVGGLSAVVCWAIWLFGPRPFDQHAPAILAYLLTLGITWPHFLASYRLLYATRESILTYRVASIYFPAALAAYGAFAVIVSPTHPWHQQLLIVAAAVYLARHYAGQTWGMMASFAHIAGRPFSPGERRACLRALDLAMVWHVTWALAQTIERIAPGAVPFVERVDRHVDWVLYASFAIATGAMAAMKRRTGTAPPARVVVPLLALYSWYALLRRDPTSLVVVQASHALQYLVFPLRIEETRKRGLGPIRALRAFAWLAGLVAVSLAVFAGLPRLLRISYDCAGGTEGLPAAFLEVFVAFVNIHHYFVDGCLYKLRNPAVRRDLFAHLGAGSAHDPRAVR
jgi:hypothetical protein